MAPAISSSPSSCGSAAWKNNAQELNDGKVRYPFHPLFGQPVQIIRRVDRSGGEIVITLPDATKCSIPAWMLDEHADDASVTCSPERLGDFGGVTDTSASQANQASVST